jgi:hypothetical protein
VNLIRRIKIRWWRRLAAAALWVDLRGLESRLTESSDRDPAVLDARVRPGGGGRPTAAPSGCSPAQRGPWARMPHLLRGSRRSEAGERVNYTGVSGRTPERRRRRTGRRSGRPRRSNSGDPASALRSAATTTDGTNGSLTLQRSSGQLPRRRQGGDGAKLRRRRR